jgi:hypothetical protein
LGQAGLTIGLMYLNGNIESDLDNYIKQDCHIFERDKVSLGEHFLSEKHSIKPEGIKQLPNTEEINTSQGLNDENIEDNKTKDKFEKLKLRDNVNSIENENEVNLTSSILSWKKEKNTTNDNVNIKNNYVYDMNISREVKTDTKTKLASKKSQHIITMRDFNSLTLEERFTYDNRSIITYCKDSLIQHHSIISIIYKGSVVDPIFIRVAKLIFTLSLIFGINALLFTEYYIQLRATSTYEVKILFN